MKKDKIGIVLDEFKQGKLKSSSGKKVKSPKQAMAIAISEANRYSENTKPLPIRDAVFRTIQTLGLDYFNSTDDDLLIDVLDVMLFASGTFNGIETTKEHLNSMVNNATKLNRVPIVKITHKEKTENSVFLEDFPFSVGEVDVSSLKVVGEYIVGNLKIFKWVVDFIYKGYLRNISAEVIHNLRTQDGNIHDRILDCIALLGSEREAQWEKLKIYNEHLYQKVNNYDKIEMYSYSEVFMEVQNEEVMAQDMPMTESEQEVEMEDKEEEMEMSKMEAMKQEIISELKNYIGEVMTNMLNNEYKEKNSESKENVEVVEQPKQDLVVQKYKEDLDFLKSQVQKLAYEKESMENDVFIDGLIKSGKIAPSLKEKASGLLNTSFKANYSENNVSFKDQIKDFLNSLEVKVEYSEKEVAPTGDVNVDLSKNYVGREKEAYIFEQLNTEKAYKYAEEKGISFEEAVSILFNS